MKTIQELFAIFSALWEKGNEIVRLSVFIILAWPTIIVMVVMMEAGQEVVFLMTLLPLVATGAIFLWKVSPLLVLIAGQADPVDRAYRKIFAIIALELVIGLALCLPEVAIFFRSNMPVVVLSAITIPFLLGSAGWSLQKIVVTMTFLIFLGVAYLFLGRGDSKALFDPVYETPNYTYNIDPSGNIRLFPKGWKVDTLGRAVFPLSPEIAREYEKQKGIQAWQKENLRKQQQKILDDQKEVERRHNVLQEEKEALERQRAVQRAEAEREKEKIAKQNARIRAEEQEIERQKFLLQNKKDLAALEEKLRTERENSRRQGEIEKKKEMTLVVPEIKKYSTPNVTYNNKTSYTIVIFDNSRREVLRIQPYESGRSTVKPGEYYFVHKGRTNRVSIVENRNNNLTFNRL